MKIKFLSIFSVTLSILMLLIFSFTSAPKTETAMVSINDNKIITVSNKESEKISSSKVLESRLLNLLNHNFIYNSDFESIENIVNGSVIALLNMRECSEDSFIAENIVSDYIFNMYGIEIEDFSNINTEFAQKSGYVYIIPRGYSTFEHEMLSVKENEDGSLTAKTKVIINSYDGNEIIDFCETLFIVNPESALGYSIISSNIGTDALAI